MMTERRGASPGARRGVTLALACALILGVCGVGTASASNYPLSGVSCPSAGQCTAVGGPGGNQQVDGITFSPTSGTVNAAGPKVIAGAGQAGAVSCPSATQCTAIVNASSTGPGQEVTFDPMTGRVDAAGVKTIDSGGYRGGFLISVACPSGSQCTAVDYGGREVTFDPATGTVNPAGVKPVFPSGDNADAVSCPSPTQCTATGNDARADSREVTFDPTTGTANAAGVQTLDTSLHQLFNVSCPSLTQCTAADTYGKEVTFDPTTGTVNAAGVKMVDSSALSSLSCPSVTQCTGIDLPQPGQPIHEVTFDPQSGVVNAAGRKAIDSVGAGGDALSCPSTTQCTAVEGAGNEVTFDPTTGTVNAAGVRAIEGAAPAGGGRPRASLRGATIAVSQRLTRTRVRDTVHFVVQRPRNTPARRACTGVLVLASVQVRHTSVSGLVRLRLNSSCRATHTFSLSRSRLRRLHAHTLRFTATYLGNRYVKPRFFRATIIAVQP